MKRQSVKIPEEVDKIIPVEERIDGFEELWSIIYDEVISYWDEVPDEND